MTGATTEDPQYELTDMELNEPIILGLEGWGCGEYPEKHHWVVDYQVF